MSTVRHATATWQGDLASGSGTVSGYSSGVFSDLPVSWASRTEAPDGRTSPEELLAAAHAACYCMALSGKLTTAGFPPDHLHVEAEVAFEKLEGGWTVTSSAHLGDGQRPGNSRPRLRASGRRGQGRLPHQPCARRQRGA